MKSTKMHATSATSGDTIGLVEIDLKGLNPDLSNDLLHLELPMINLPWEVITNELESRGFSMGDCERMISAFHKELNVLQLADMLSERMR